jgi:restriction endonuclease S subunit
MRGLSESDIPLPPLPAQRRIVAELDTLQAEVEIFTAICADSLKT